MNNEKVKKARLLQSLLSRFATFDERMQFSTAQVFIEIATANLKGVNITNKDIQDRLGLNSGTVTRNIYYWTEEGHPSNSGQAGLVEVQVSLQDRRQRELKLTPKGLRFINDVIAALD